MEDSISQLAHIDPSARILLLPHCLRQSNTCKAKYNDEGLQCLGCNPDCAVNRLRAAALDCGYLGVCVAPGGRLAIKFVKAKQPKAIVAVACEKELQEGIQGVKELSWDTTTPVIVIIPLITDGCVNTEVDTEEAVEIINTGSIAMAGNPLN